jgi:hypothetical protein
LKHRQGDIPAVMRVLEMFDWVKPAGWRNGQATHWQINPAVHDGRFSIMADKERARRTSVRGPLRKKRSIGAPPVDRVPQVTSGDKHCPATTICHHLSLAPARRNKNASSF